MIVNRSVMRIILLCAALLQLVLLEVESFQIRNPLSASSSRAGFSSDLSRNPVVFMSSFYDESFFYEDDNDDDDDDEDDSMIDPDSLGDWRMFRRNLATTTTTIDEDDNNDGSGSCSDLPGGESRITSTTGESSSGSSTTSRPRVKVCRENEDVLKSQNPPLAKEFMKDVWCHEVSTPEVGGLLARMPLEVEVYRNYKHSHAGRKLRETVLLLDDDDDGFASIAEWYQKAHRFVEGEIMDIAGRASGDDGQIETKDLDQAASEMLQLYLDNQETWQEVCLVLERNENDGTGSTLVLNRPMALKLTENLARLVLYGAFGDNNKAAQSQGTTTGDGGGGTTDLVKFMLAFGQECAVYIGGPDHQEMPAEILHGFEELEGAHEISPGSGIYRGGIRAAVDGVISGQYRPLDFRFFVGRHSYEESIMDLAVVLGKYQPFACARCIPLKQCLSLPKPLWHEVLEMAGGEMEEISRLETMKRDDIKFQIVEEEDEDIDIDDGIDDDEYVDIDDLPDELDELGNKLDEDDDELFYLG